MNLNYFNIKYMYHHIEIIKYTVCYRGGRELIWARCLKNSYKTWKCSNLGILYNEFHDTSYGAKSAMLTLRYWCLNMG